MDLAPAGTDSAGLERPSRAASGNAAFGSDAVAEALRTLGIPYIALNPGASYRGLHDSLVNHLGNERPQMLLCLHEEHAVALAQGWAKVTGRALAAAVHSNVGLFHATMAIFNAWCDRMPVLIIGATGPVDAAQRRPWIDWIHTARDQGAIIRNFVKWDDQPASPAAAREALLRAAWLAETAPAAPVYVNLDAAMQEAPLDEPLPPLDAARFMPKVAAELAPGLAARAVALLREAKRPVILMGRVSRSEAAWQTRVALAEALQARVATDLKLGAAFPTDHPLHAGAPGVFAVPETARAIAGADAVLSLDWVDLAGTLRAACGTAPSGARVIQVSLDHHLHNGWSMDHQGLPPVDLFLAADPDAAAAAMLAVLRPDGAAPEPPPRAAAPHFAAESGPITVPQMARALRAATGDRAVSLLHLPLSWDGALWPFRHPLDFLGGDGGGGIGGGPGISVGAALALRGSGRLPVSICGDGDFLMGATALWTASHYRIPLLLVVANNQSFFNDEVHQERMARMRGRPVENKWIGQRMTDPEIDLAGIARAQGAAGFGPLRDAAELEGAFRRRDRSGRGRCGGGGRCARRAGLYAGDGLGAHAREQGMIPAVTLHGRWYCARVGGRRAQDQRATGTHDEARPRKRRGNVMRKLALLMLLSTTIAGGAQAETLKVAVGQKGNWDTSIMDYGIRQGFFRQEGLDIDEIYTPGGAPTLQAVISGSVDIGIGTGLLGTLGAYAKGAPVRVIQAETTGAADLFWYARPESNIHGLKDTGGKTIGFSEPGSSTDLVLRALLRAAGVSNARPVPTGGIPATLTQVMSGQIDVGWSVPPASLQSVQDGKLVIVAHGNDAPEIRGETIRVNVANANSLKTKRDAMQKWGRAYVKSLDWAFSDPKAIDYFAEGMKVPHTLAQSAREQFYPKAAMAPFTIGDEAAVLQQAYDFKFTPRRMTPQDVAGMIDFLGKPAQP